MWGSSSAGIPGPSSWMVKVTAKLFSVTLIHTCFPASAETCSMQFLITLERASAVQALSQVSAVPSGRLVLSSTPFNSARMFKGPMAVSTSSRAETISFFSFSISASSWARVRRFRTSQVIFSVCRSIFSTNSSRFSSGSSGSFKRSVISVIPASGVLI